MYAAEDVFYRKSISRYFLRWIALLFLCSKSSHFSFYVESASSNSKHINPLEQSASPYETIANYLLRNEKRQLKEVPGKKVKEKKSRGARSLSVPDKNEEDLNQNIYSDGDHREEDDDEEFGYGGLKQRRQSQPSLTAFSSEEIKRALERLAEGQAAIKSMDGATHMLNSAITDGKTDSLAVRYSKLRQRESENEEKDRDRESGEDGEGKRSKAFRKEASKVYEYVNTVERSLQCCEILQSVGEAEGTRRRELLEHAGLVEVGRYPIEHDRVRLICSVLMPVAEESPVGMDGSDRGKTGDSGGSRKVGPSSGRFGSGEIVIAVTDDCKMESVLRVCSQGSVGLELESVGLVDEEIAVHPTLLELAALAFAEVRGFLVERESPTEPPEGKEAEAVGHGHGAVTDDDREAPLALGSEPDEDMDGRIGIERKNVRKKSDGKEERRSKKKAEKRSKGKLNARGGARNGEGIDSIRTPKSGPKSSSRSVVDEPMDANSNFAANSSSSPSFSAPISISGHKLPKKVRLIGHSLGGAVAAYMAMVLEGSIRPSATPEASSSKISSATIGRLAQHSGLYDESRIRCLAVAPPPCISRSLVPRYVTTIICGDDVVPRSTVSSLSYLRERVSSQLEVSRSLLGRVIPGSSFLGDIASFAGKGLKQYASGAHDLTSLSLPGRVFYMKSRSHRKGASFQRVLRGNWREDMLWQLHDVLLSKRMLQHHSIESHIQVLARC